MDDWTCMKRAYAVKHAGRGGTSLDAVITIGHPRPSQFGPTVHIRQPGCRNLVNDGARSATWIAEHHFDAVGMHGLDASLGLGATWPSSGHRFDLGVIIGHAAFQIGREWGRERE